MMYACVCVCVGGGGGEWGGGEGGAIRMEYNTSKYLVITDFLICLALI